MGGERERERESERERERERERELALGHFLTSSIRLLTERPPLLLTLAGVAALK